MAFGSGKYDDFATLVRGATNAEAVVVIVKGGKRGSGFAQQIIAASNLEAAESVQAMADILREIASVMEVDAKVLLHKSRQEAQ